MSKKIYVQLTAQSIDNAIREIKADRAKDVERVNMIIDAMCLVGENVAKMLVEHVDTGETINSIVGYREGDKGLIIAGGAAVWLEFGTGVTKNGAKHPKADELGIAPWGTYGSGKGSDPAGWWYYDEEDKPHHTYGITANMFMYRTAQYLQDQWKQMAREAFKK